MQTKKFKIGLFAFNASSGVTLTKDPKRWAPSWEDIKKISQDAEKMGLDFLLPIARWNDWGGETRPHKMAFETFSLMSSIASITNKIYLFSTVHTAFVHPIYAARASTTINNISNGRFGVNIVCGWNKSEYEMFNVEKKISSINRYKFGDEWLSIYLKLLNKKNDKISYKGKFIQVKNAQCYPKMVDEKNFLKISAGFSKDGREFAAKKFDILLTMFSKIENLKKNNQEIIDLGKKNNKNIQIFSPIHIICKNSKNEAQEFYDMYSQNKQDFRSVNNFISNLAWAKKDILASYLRQVKKQVAGSLGGFTIIGNKKDVAEQINEIYKSKTSGIALTFFDFRKDLSFFGKNVLKKIKRF